MESPTFGNGHHGTLAHFGSVTFIRTYAESLTLTASGALTLSKSGAIDGVAWNPFPFYLTADAASCGPQAWAGPISQGRFTVYRNFCI